jgi:hypothetical protein
LPVSRRDAFNKMMSRLVADVGVPSLSLKSSKDIYASYLNSFNSAFSIGTSLYASATPAAPIVGPTFPVLYQAYYDQINNVVNNHPFFLRIRELRPQHYNTYINDQAYRFALAEFLIVNNLSAVVDVPTMFQDGHSSNYLNEIDWKPSPDVISVLTAYACMTKLIASLKSYPLPGSPGKSLLDATTLIMFSEFDRTPAYSYLQSYYSNIPGTGHWITSSAVLAGAGVNGGKVVGRIAGGPGEGRYANVSGGTTGLGDGYKIDFKTGLPDTNGQTAYIENIFPTMMAIFGLSVPERQKTADGAIAAIMK